MAKIITEKSIFQNYETVERICEEFLTPINATYEIKKICNSANTFVISITVDDETMNSEEVVEVYGCMNALGAYRLDELALFPFYIIYENLSSPIYHIIETDNHTDGKDVKDFRLVRILSGGMYDVNHINELHSGRFRDKINKDNVTIIISLDTYPDEQTEPSDKVVSDNVFNNGYIMRFEDGSVHRGIFNSVPIDIFEDINDVSEIGRFAETIAKGILNDKVMRQQFIDDFIVGFTFWYHPETNKYRCIFGVADKEYDDNSEPHYVECEVLLNILDKYYNVKFN